MNEINQNPLPASLIPYLKTHLDNHPSMTSQDIAKLCYQAAHGAEHLLADLDRARRYLEHEMDSVEANECMTLIEPISDRVARVNLAPWKAKGLSADALFDLFVATARVSGNGDERLSSYLSEVSDYLASEPSSIALTEWMTFLAWYDQNGRPAIHHSEAYRAAEHPAYRIVLRDLLCDVDTKN